MGSLMSGWDSHGYLGRSSSFAKDEIEDFRKKQKLSEEEHLRAAALLAEHIRRAQQEDGLASGIKKAIIKAEDDSQRGVGTVEEELERQNSFKDWWTKSGCAFLNEPAMKRVEAADHKYKAQFHFSLPAFPLESH